MNKILTKKVNVYPVRPVWFGKKDLRANTMGITMNIGDIYNAILAMAKVEEVLKDGSTVILTTSNYNKDNEPVVTEPDNSPSSDQNQGIATASLDTEPVSKVADTKATAEAKATTTAAKATTTNTTKK